LVSLIFQQLELAEKKNPNKKEKVGLGSGGEQHTERERAKDFAVSVFLFFRSRR
jgi:hypothetical protein